MLAWITAVIACHAGERDAHSRQSFDVIVAGGSTAAFASAIAAAESGARTLLIEPTNWVGGQLTASGVPAVDEAWHTIREPGTERPLLNVAAVARMPQNITPNFNEALTSISDPGECWVSRFCFCPDQFVVNQLQTLQDRVGDRLVVLLDTVVKDVEVDETGRRIVALTTITRTPRPDVAAQGYDVLPSQDLADWYSAADSARFTKQVRRIEASPTDGTTIFIDATEWGEVLALTDAPYLIGVESSDGGTQGDDTCGQATVYCFVERFHREPAADPAPPAHAERLGYGSYRERDDAWEKIWTYRRIRGSGHPGPGDLCLQNWGYSFSLGEGGNDYPFGYLFKGYEATRAERAEWQGGINPSVLAAAEQRAFAWHQWFKEHAPAGIDPRQITLDSTVLGTTHGLAKLPYIRDTRRSIGLDGFVLKLADLTGPAEQKTGTRFADRIALGAYPADIHPTQCGQIPEYLSAAHDTLPFYIPFRALTNKQLENFLVAGKTMAQSFAANSATRLHPIEWSTGAAAGVAAAYMARTGKTASEAYASLDELRPLIAEKTPVDWTFPAAATEP